MKLSIEELKFLDSQLKRGCTPTCEDYKLSKSLRKKINDKLNEKNNKLLYKKELQEQYQAFKLAIENTISIINSESSIGKNLIKNPKTFQDLIDSIPSIKSISNMNPHFNNGYKVSVNTNGLTENQLLEIIRFKELNSNYYFKFE